MKIIHTFAILFVATGLLAACAKKDETPTTTTATENAVEVASSAGITESTQDAASEALDQTGEATSESASSASEAEQTTSAAAEETIN